MEKLIYIYRHGETDLNKAGIIQGSGVDAPLNTTGRLQAKAFYEKYKKTPFEVVLTSALQRTHQTVEPFLKQELPWEQHPEINEMSWGDHEGKPGTPELRASYRAMVEAWQQGDFDASIGGGESAAEMAARVRIFVDKLKVRTEKTLLVCAHGRLMRCLMCVLKEQPLQEMEQYHHSNTGLYKIKYQEGRFDFLLENDTKHLDALANLKLR